MKIIKLESENIKRLKAVEIQPDSSLIVIGGKNAQGKTSVLDSIEYALSGGSSIPSKPIRKGEKKARVVVEMDNLIVTRTFTESGSKLIVSDKQGFPKTSPQALLDSLTGKLSFDPLAFCRMDSEKQLKTMKDLVGLDFSHLDEEKKKIYDERTQVNREMKSLQAQVGAVERYEDVPKQEISYPELLAEQERRINVNHQNEKWRVEMNSLLRVETEHAVYMDELREKIKNLRMKWDEAVDTKREIENKLLILCHEVENLQDEDIDSIRTQISQAEETNQKIRSNLKHNELEFDFELKQKRSEKMTGRLEEIDSEKEKLIASSKLPIPGLSFDENGINYNGIPFNQSGDAEKIRISVAMGFAMNPKLKVLLIRDGSLLDEDNLKMVAEMAEEAGGQLWLERVGEGKECQVIIENGRVK